MQKSRSDRKKYIQPSHLILIIFSLLVLFSVFGLDFIGWKKEDRSYFFSALLGEKKTAYSQETLEQVVLKSLPLHAISNESVQQFRDTKGALHLMIDLSTEAYKQMESYLESELAKVQAPILGKEEQPGEDKNYYLWQVGGEKEKGLIILFSVRKDSAGEPVSRREEPTHQVAIIIDDMGYSLEAIQEICSFQKPLTVSILPFSPLARETARIAHQNNLEVMLHLPLESINSDGENDIEGLIHSQMSEEEIRRTMDTDLERVPYIKGVNNHMGSKITPNETFMNIILGAIKDKNLFFIDSRTSAQSMAYTVAQRMRIPTAYRHVFLDGESREDYIKNQLIELFRRAQRNKKAVGIGHPTNVTLKVLRENLHLADKYKLELVFVSQIVD
ncbi:MAG: divergent polysaccharide deacetylase family protein [Candidatus Aminicenantes bacterium]|nr:MAG: divergent polysaccharide deacetylase family protein [Candidatus Aminicenantes bacterium]